MNSLIFESSLGKKVDPDSGATYNQFFDTSYAPITNFKFDVESEKARKNVVRTSAIAFFSSFILLIFVGPDPWAHHIQFESDDWFVIFMAWDTLVATALAIFLLLGLSKKSTTLLSGLISFRNKVLIAVILETLTLIFVAVTQGVHIGTADNVVLRLMVISLSLIVLNTTKKLEEILKFKSNLSIEV